jgi:hypothetical protein
LGRRDVAYKVNWHGCFEQRELCFYRFYVHPECMCIARTISDALSFQQFAPKPKRGKS